MSAVPEHCPTCGSLVHIISGDEGTSHYEPVRESAGAGLDVERAAIIAAARLEDEVSRLRAELANCTAAYESVAPLNAELLAEAFTKVQPGVYGQDWPRDDPDEFQFLSPREHATAIAAEYARLAAAHLPENPNA